MTASVEPPSSPWTHALPFERKGGRRHHQVAHLIAPVQPWNEFIEGYVNNLVEKVGGTQEAWTNVMSLSASEVRKALALSMMTPRGSMKQRQMPEEITDAINALLNTLPPEYKHNSAKLSFALHDRPFYCSALQKHVELVLWGLHRLMGLQA